MISRKTTIDNSVKYILQSEQIQKIDSKPNTIKKSVIRNQKSHKAIKNFLQIDQHQFLTLLNHEK